MSNTEDELPTDNASVEQAETQNTQDTILQDADDTKIPTKKKFDNQPGTKDSNLVDKKIIQDSVETPSKLL